MLNNPLNFFTFFYLGAAWGIYLLALPLLFLFSFKPKYRQALNARFFLRNNPAFTEESPLWFHACSFGEVRSLAPILPLCREPVVLSVITRTGFAEAQKYRLPVRYLPFEIFLPFWMPGTRTLVVLEAELWYMLFFLVKRRGGKTVLLNARISDRSFHRYLKMRWFYRRIFANIDRVFAQSAKDRERLEALGAQNVEVIGNIKMFHTVQVKNHYPKPDKRVITAASTHGDEEAMIARAWHKAGAPGMLIVVPRHPERFAKVRQFLDEFARFHHYRFATIDQRDAFEADVLLVDRMGELNEIYAVSHTVLLGGAWEKIGGHNPLEPAHFGCRIVTGPYYFNQKPLIEGLDNILVAESEEELVEAIHITETAPGAAIRHTPDMSLLQKALVPYVG